MDRDERQANFIKRMLAYTEKLRGLECTEVFDDQENTKAFREKLIKTNHYYHILQIIGVSEVNPRDSYVAFTLAKEKISKARDKDEQRSEIIKMNLVDGHTAALNIARYHYERASKTLCQMMITLMDYIIQEKGEESILYENLDKTKYFNLLDEICSLNEDYLDSYYALSAYDYCTEKIGDYMNLQEYKALEKEHARIIENGIPERVSNVMKRLKGICGDKRREVFIDIEKSYTPEPEYSENKFDECYKKAMEQYESEDMAMTDFSSLVEIVNQLYQKAIEV